MDVLRSKFDEFRSALADLETDVANLVKDRRLRAAAADQEVLHVQKRLHDIAGHFMRLQEDLRTVTEGPPPARPKGTS